MMRAILTYRGYEALPDDGRRHEIHDGEFSMTHTPPPQHQIVQPDVVHLAPDRLDRISERGLEGPPPLAVEILAPSTRTIDRVTKRRLYVRHGMPFLWLVDPDGRAIEAFVLERDRYVLAAGAAGPDAADLPPFTGLGLPDSPWP